MISYSNNFIFIHINKTGGSSIEKAFEDSPDLVIIPERLIKSNLNSNKFNNNLVITKVMDEINTSIMFWQDKG